MARPATSVSIWFAVTTVLIDAIGVGIIFPVLPDLLLEMGVTDIAQAALWGGILTTAYALMQFLFAPVVGNLSDRFGRRPVMLLALVALAIDYVIMGFAGALWLLFVGRVIAGIAGATYSTASAVIADVSSRDRRAANFGLIGAAFGLGFIIGPALGGLVGEYSTRAPFFVAAVLAGANFLFGWLAFPESLPADRRRPFQWRRSNPFGALIHAARLPALAPLLLALLVFHIAGFVYPAIWSFWGKAAFGWDAGMIGLSLAAYGVGMIVSQGLLIRYASRRFGDARTSIAGFVFAVIALVAFSLVDQGWIVFALVPLAAISDLAEPALIGVLANRVGDDEQGALQGVIASLASIAAIISPAPFAGVFHAGQTGWITGASWPGAPFAAAALIMVGATWVLIVGLRRPQSV